LAIMLESTTLFISTAAEVSSQDDSIPRIYAGINLAECYCLALVHKFARAKRKLVSRFKLQKYQKTS
jgi:hypothetical protein